VIDRLRGQLVESEITEAVIDVGGVGFAVTIPLSTYDRLPAAGGQVSLHTHLHVREDLLQLYAFFTPGERRLFRLLITVSGIGPRIALNVLSCMTVGGFCSTVAAGDVKALVRVNGLGRKSAERMVMELRDRIAEIDPGAALPEGGEDPSAPEVADAVAALETLGFKADKARQVVKAVSAELPAAGRSTENLIRKSLQRLNS
jgi:Holliday junction DNA helicase RuvA